MTGIGRCRGKIGKTFVTAEIRSVNHKFCEVSVRSPQKYLPFEFPISQLVKKRISRGKIEVSIGEERGSGGGDVEISSGRLREFYSLLKKTSREFGIAEPIGLTHLLTGVSFWTTRDDGVSERDWPAVKRLVEKAIANLVTMRHREGTVLCLQLKKRRKVLEGLLGKIRLKREGVTSEIGERLKQRLTSVTSDLHVDPARLATEIVFYVDRSDITEEIERLVSHFNQMQKMMESIGPCGRSLDFLIQEMNREWNTIASKAQNVSISHWIVAAKSEMEKMREQIQNVE